MALELMIVLPSAIRAGVSTNELGVLLVVTTVHVAADIWMVSGALDSLRSRHPARGRLRARLVAVAISTVVTLICLYLAIGPGATGMAVYCVALAWGSIVPTLDYRRAGLGVAVIAVVLSVVVLSTADGPLLGRLVSVLILVSVASALSASVWLSGWMLRVYWELNVARLDSARLAIADERLRISRDLHDVFGRTLATVSVKSELAAELARRGRSEEAADEIGQVGQIADQAAKEIRRVLHGYREADLVVELQGARSLLAAAGVICTVDLAPAPISPGATSTLAWVTREAVTNMIKHARATRAAITVTDGDPLVLTIDNDGASPLGAGPPAAGLSAGQGLRGMAERVAAAGGRLEHGYAADHFTVRVELPTGTG